MQVGAHPRFAQRKVQTSTPTVSSGSNQYYYDELVTACQYFTGQTGDLTQKIKDKCDGERQSRKCATNAALIIIRPSR